GRQLHARAARELGPGSDLRHQPGARQGGLRRLRPGDHRPDHARHDRLRARARDDRAPPQPAGDPVHRARRPHHAARRGSGRHSRPSPQAGRTRRALRIAEVPPPLECPAWGGAELEIVYFVVLNALGHLAFVGARMTTTLYALNLGASEFDTGVLMSLFALLPAVLSVSAGRLIDRAGPRRPLTISLAVLAAAAALPFAFPYLEILYLSTSLLGVSFMYVHIAMNSVFGAHGSPEQRALNFS